MFSSLNAMTSSFQEEIDAVKRATPAQLLKAHNNTNDDGKSDRVSSMTSVDTFDSSNYNPNDLVVGFPSQKSAQPMNGTMGGSGAPRHRNSVTLNPGALKGLAGLDDSDFDDSDDEGTTPAKKVPTPEPRKMSNPKASGGPEHRPLVGGFAAAAYEAARMDHYKKQGLEVKGHAPPRPRSHYPGYP